ncbi:MAG: class I tRNA ligase family protein [Saprospiraceae bacterium]
MEYNFSEIETKWKKYWEENQVYKVSNNSNKPKYYVLDMFPYPSGAGLHVGHPLGYIASDIFTRYKRMQGHEVLHPMGFDSFGLPAEQYAIQTGIHPEKTTAENIKRYRAQLDNIGFSFDWSRQVSTCEPEFYKWTQWIFIELFNHWYDQNRNTALPISELEIIFSREGNRHLNAARSPCPSFSASQWYSFSRKEKSDLLMNYRLAYRKEAFVNWCEALGTVLANDEVKDGVSERGGHPVERKPMTQWFLRITAYAQRLLDDLKDVDFTDSMKIMQSNWIGRSTGAQVFFDIDSSIQKLEIYTTRADTIFGATFMVLAPEHELVDIITTTDQRKAIDQYLEFVKSRSERDRMAEVKEVSGAFTGAFAINPFNQEKIPIWIGEYVLKDYGTGAIMAVPADDARDNAFAKKYHLPIVEIIDKSMYPGATIEDKLGKMINSDFINGMEVLPAIDLICNRLESMGIGKKQINFKMRDANFSRQRYWGEPFPIIYDNEGIPYTLDKNELPLELPALDDFKPTTNGKAPLSKLESWVKLPNGHTRETDTMPGFAGSSWYFLRYMDPNNQNEFASKEAITYWQDVDLYVGGTEHAVGHLLYSRFWHKFLFDLGLTVTKEPYKRLLNQGMIQGISESIYLLKEKHEGRNLFVSKELIKKYDEKEYIRIAVPISYVKDYGTENPFLDHFGLMDLLLFYKEYSDNSLFEIEQGIKNFTEILPDSQYKLYTHSEVAKMSKSQYNVINPDDVIEKYGSDCFRLFEMFLGPLEQSKPWDTRSIDGVGKFVRRLWASFYSDDVLTISDQRATDEELKILHKGIKKISDDIERFSFNTCVSQFMIILNELKSINCNKREILDPLVRLIAPFAPFLSEELWSSLGHSESVHKSRFPQANEKYLVESIFTYPICINGKKRGTYDFPADASQDTLIDMTLKLDFVNKWLDGNAPKKVIVVPGKMINIVI